MLWNGYSERTVTWERGIIKLIDQRKLPNKLEFIECNNHLQVVDAIKNMAIRGAPALGAVAAMALGLVCYKSKAKTKEDLIKELDIAVKDLSVTRPTGMNLFFTIQRVMNKAKTTEGSVKDIIDTVINEALLISEEDIKINHEIGRHGAKILENNDIVLTHCK